MRRLPAAASTATTKKKKSRPTGAKKVIFEASGPGFSFCGSAMPMGWLATRLAKVHSPCQRARRCACCADGESVPAGKSTPAKSVSTARWNARTWPVPAVSW